MFFLIQEDEWFVAEECIFVKLFYTIYSRYFWVKLCLGYSKFSIQYSCFGNKEQ